MGSKALIKPVTEIVAFLDREGRNRAPELMELFGQIHRLLSGHLTAAHIKDGSLTDALIQSLDAAKLTGTLSPDRIAANTINADLKLALESVTRRLLAVDVIIPRFAQGRYTGDGTANRVIATSDAIGAFTPTEVLVLATTDVNEFYSRDDATAVLSWYRLAAGTAQGNAAEWQGIVATGFKTGSNAASLSNKNGQVYSWAAWRRG